MKFLQEVTEWSGLAQNHVYIMNDSRTKAIAYVRLGTDTPFKFSSPMRMSLRGRKFVEVKNVWGFSDVDPEVPTGCTWQVAGSKGTVYTVSEENGGLACTCSGFKFRGKCRHLEEVVRD